MNAKLKETILNPILKGNPITVLVLGICRYSTFKLRSISDEEFNS